MAKANVYGWVNGKEVYSRDEFIYTVRGFGEITDDSELLAYAEKVTDHWYIAGWRKTFTTFFLSDYSMAKPYNNLTVKEFERLKEMQDEARKQEKAADDARGWVKIKTIYWADNSIEEVWEDKDGIQKTVQITGAHGDAC